MKKYNDVQAKLDQLPALYIQEHKKSWSFNTIEMEDFILKFLVELAQKYSVIQKGTDMVECKPTKRRSVSDVYRLCKYYYDDVTLIEVQWILAKLWKKNKIGYFYCNSIKKRVYMGLEYYKTHTVNPVQYGSPDEFGISPDDITKLSTTKYDDL